MVLDREQILLALGGILMISQIISSSIAYSVLKNYSSFETPGSCFLYVDPSNTASYFTSSCNSGAVLFMFSILGAISYLGLSGFIFYKGLTRSKSMIFGTLAAQAVFLILSLAGASLFTAGLKQTAFNFGDDNVKEFASWYSEKYAGNSGLVNSAMNAGWASVFLWIFTCAMEGYSVYQYRKTYSATTFQKL